MNATTAAIDLAKNVFQVALADANARGALRGALPFLKDSVPFIPYLSLIVRWLPILPGELAGEAQLA